MVMSNLSTENAEQTLASRTRVINICNCRNTTTAVRSSSSNSSGRTQSIAASLRLRRYSLRCHMAMYVQVACSTPSSSTFN